jgi:hypothetical protein
MGDDMRVGRAKFESLISKKMFQIKSGSRPKPKKTKKKTHEPPKAA